MSLVGYGSSSEESEAEAENDQSTEKQPLKTEVEHLPSTPGGIREDDGSSSIFKSLPAPKNLSSNAVIESKVQTLDEPEVVPVSRLNLPPPKKKSQPVKITIPSLPEPDSDDDEEPEAKKSKKELGISGLFSILPQPKYKTGMEASRMLIPYALTKKKTGVAPAPIKTKPGPPKPSLSKPSVLGLGYTSDDEDEEDDESSSNFFSLGEKDKTEEEAKPSLAGMKVTEEKAQTSFEGTKTTVKKSALVSPLRSNAVSSTTTNTFSKKHFSQVKSEFKPQLHIPQSSAPLRTGTSNPSIASSSSSSIKRQPQANITQSVTGARTGIGKTTGTGNVSSSTNVTPAQPAKKSKLVTSNTEYDPSSNDVPLSFAKSNHSKSSPYAATSSYPSYSANVNQSYDVQSSGGYVDQYPQADYSGSLDQGYTYGPDPQPEFAGSSQGSFSQDQEFQKLIGKKNRGKEAINIIDINADEHLGTAKPEDWLIKSMTEEKQARNKLSKEQLPTTQQKRKHQITYLARQAKERELELKNSWADNRVTRKHTQAKYGF